MASSLSKKPSCPSLNIKPSYKRAPGVAMRVRARRPGDEGKSSNIVDANLNVLRGRIENVKIKERLERCCRCEHGWNYTPGYNFKLKKEVGLPTQFIDLASLVFGTVGLTCLGGTLFLCVVSLLVRLIQ
ncbi:hypothetical protein SADUNF_Sadunf04G0065500 [Salix dunnii]|uniref:Uncharacterized protein n=1 Tax=Salix dunnii TaxID=1413687 RepID=A0A835K775_9ROSI|nr:hypothetical protein SADUNF_Sadunf04G0065500 [Salix dunnii]